MEYAYNRYVCMVLLDQQALSHSLHPLNQNDGYLTSIQKLTQDLHCIEKPLLFACPELKQYLQDRTKKYTEDQIIHRNLT